MRILPAVFLLVICAGLISCGNRQTTHRKPVVDSLGNDKPTTTRLHEGKVIVVGVNDDGRLFYYERGGRDTISRFIQYSDLDSIIRANTNTNNAAKDQVYFSICECPNFKYKDLGKLVNRLNSNGVREFGLYRNRPCPK